MFVRDKQDTRFTYMKYNQDYHIACSLRLITPRCLDQTWGKHLAQILEALPQALRKGLKHQYKCFNEVNASSTK